MLGLNTLYFLIAAIVVLLVFFAGVGSALKWIRRVPPNKALIKYGFSTQSNVKVLKKVEKPFKPGIPREYETHEEETKVNFRIIRSGWAIVLPILHEVQALDLSVRTLDLNVTNVLSKEAVPISVDGIAQVKIGGDDVYIATAAEQLLGKDTEDLDHLVSETLKGHLRAIIGTLTVSEVFKDREAFSRSVTEVAYNDLAGLGIQIVSFVIKDINDTKGYLDSLGAPEIAAKKKDARVAEAAANRDASKAEQEAMKATAEYERDTNKASAEYAAEVATARAVADKAGPISAAQQQAELEMRQAEAAEQAAFRRDKELDAEVRRRADADKYAAEQQAAGDLAKGTAAADIERLKLIAQAEGNRKLVEVYNLYGPEALQVVLVGDFIRNMPLMVDAATQHLAEIDSVHVVDLGGGAGNANGSSALGSMVDEGIASVAKVLKTAPALLGDDLMAVLQASLARKGEELGVETQAAKAKPAGSKKTAKPKKPPQEPPAASE